MAKTDNILFFLNGLDCPIIISYSPEISPPPMSMDVGYKIWQTHFGATVFSYQTCFLPLFSISTVLSSFILRLPVTPEVLYVERKNVFDYFLASSAAGL